MEIATWNAAAPAVTAAFLASAVEIVEAFTIVLAVGMFSGWRPALLGTGAGLAVLAGLILALGPLLGQVPIHALQFVVGVLLLLFGMRWLRKAVLRSAGIIALHDEQAVFAEETAHLHDAALRHKNGIAWMAGLAAFKAIVLEGVEVVFVVIAVGAGRGHLWAASLGALAACAIVLAIGLLVHKPLSRVPENTLKFGVGVMLSAFGVFWTGEGLGISWPGQDLAIVAFAALFLATGLSLAAMLRRPLGEIAR
jgi:Ca2+/H+ antiporter, TMEM165/GDT1 family